MPTPRDENEAIIADAIAALCSIYTGAAAEGDHDLRQRLGRFDDAQLAVIARQLDAIAQELA